MKTYRNVVGYALAVSSGENVEPGQDVQLAASPDDHDLAHIEAGRLVEVSTTKKTNKEGDK